MYKVVLWGTLEEYEYYIKWVKMEEYKKNIVVCGYIMTDWRDWKNIDGIDIYKMEDLLWLKYDYIVNFNMNYENQIKEIITLLNIDNQKIIAGKVFKHISFDFKRYIELRKRNLSIVASHCWGGGVYNMLGMQFASPFINLFCSTMDFLKMMENLKGYMELELKFCKEVYDVAQQVNYPVAMLGNVEIHFQHYNSFEYAKECWERRKKRINYDNIIVETVLYTEEEVSLFEHIPYDQKIGFSRLKTDNPNIITLSDEDVNKIQHYYNGSDTHFLFDKAIGKINEGGVEYDILKLLNGEECWRRIV